MPGASRRSAPGAAGWVAPAPRAGEGGAGGGGGGARGDAGGGGRAGAGGGGGGGGAAAGGAGPGAPRLRAAFVRIMAHPPAIVTRNAATARRAFKVSYRL